MFNAIGNFIGNSSSRGGIPEASDALFHLNGVIEEDAGSYYFSDNTGNGRRFLITGKDFPSDWTVGFPYKSKATISAPAGDATLIAADINNYLYAGDGTPNEIPVVSLFQDIDYEHKLFTRHVAQVVDANNEETVQPRVAEIVLYNTVKADELLTSCQSYFSVPTEETVNVYWISKDGNNTTGTGSKENPWLTIAKATAAGGPASGSTVYVKTGDYLEDHNSSGSGYMMVQKVITVSGLGFTRVRAGNTGQVIFNNGAGATSCTLNHLVIGNAVASSVAVINGNAATNFNINQCWVKNGAYGINGGTSPSVTVTNSIYSGITNRFINSANTNTVVTGCKSTDAIRIEINGATAFRTGTYKYNDLKNCSVSSGFSVEINCSFNKCATIIMDGDSDVTDAATSLLITRNILSNPDDETLIDINANFVDTEITYNTLQGTFSGNDIHTGEQSECLIKGNKLIGLNGVYSKITVQAPTAVAKNVIVDGNLIVSDGDNHPIQVGDEVSTAGFSSITGIIKNNRIIGSENTAGSHGVSIFNQSGMPIRYNYIEGYTFGYITKVEGTDLTAADISYNISVNCGNGISAKGGLNQSICNNTIINALNGIAMVINDLGGGHNTLNTQLKNNIIFDDQPVDANYVAISLQSGCTLVSDNNLIYSLNNADKFSINGGGSDITLAQWRAQGYDTNSIITDPALAAGYIPASPITIGENLGADFLAGVDVSTNWGTSSSVPVVVTRDQQAVGDWEIGAYVQR